MPGRSASNNGYEAILDKVPVEYQLGLKEILVFVAGFLSGSYQQGTKDTLLFAAGLAASVIILGGGKKD